jgi:hypothetical protein
MVIYAGLDDKIVNIEDVREVKKRLSNIRSYNEIHADHISFFIGKNMTYVDHMVKEIINNI